MGNRNNGGKARVPRPFKYINFQRTVRVALLTLLGTMPLALTDSVKAATVTLSSGCEIILESIPANDNDRPEPSRVNHSVRNVIVLPLNRKHRFDLVLSLDILLENLPAAGVPGPLTINNVHPLAGAFLQALEGLDAHIHILALPSLSSVDDTLALLDLIDLPDGRGGKDLFSRDDIHLFHDVLDEQAAMYPALRNRGPFMGRRKINIDNLPGLNKTSAVVLTREAQWIAPEQELSFFVLHQNSVFQSQRVHLASSESRRFQQESLVWGKQGGGNSFDLERLTYWLADVNRFALILGVLHQSLGASDASKDFRHNLWKLNWRRSSDGLNIDYNVWAETREAELLPNFPLHDQMDVYTIGSRLIAETGAGTGFIGLFDREIVLSAFEEFKTVLTTAEYAEIQWRLSNTKKIPPATLLSGHVWQVIARYRKLFQIYHQLKTKRRSNRF